jgi:hypothetical protein
MSLCPSDRGLGCCVLQRVARHGRRVRCQYLPGDGPSWRDRGSFLACSGAAWPGQSHLNQNGHITSQKASQALLLAATRGKDRCSSTPRLAFASRIGADLPSRTAQSTVLEFRCDCPGACTPVQSSYHLGARCTRRFSTFHSATSR